MSKALKPGDALPFPEVMSQPTAKPRARFQFSSPTAQRAEALVNVRETLALTEAHLPKHLREPAPKGEATTAAGATFRRVTRILNRQEQ